MSQLAAITGNKRLRQNQVAGINAKLPFLPQMIAQKSQAELQKASIADMEARRKLEEMQYGLAEKGYGLDEKKYGLEQQKVGLEERGLGLQERGLGIQERGVDLEASKLEQDRQRFSWEQNLADKQRNLQQEAEKRQMGIQAGGLGFNILGGALGKGATIGSAVEGAKNMFSSIPYAPGGGTSQPSSAGTGFWSSIPIGASIGGGLMGFGGAQLLGGNSKVKKAAIGAGIGGLAGFLGGGSGGSWSGALGGGLLGGLGGLF